MREIERENNIIHMYCFIVLRVLLLHITRVFKRDVCVAVE